MDGFYDRVLSSELIHDLAGAVFRTIVDGQYFNFVPVVVAVHKGLEHMGRHPLFVVHGHQHADRWSRESHQFHHVLGLRERYAIESEKIVPDRVDRQNPYGEAKAYLAGQDQEGHDLLPPMFLLMDRSRARE
jgi:hypothetical protein